MKAALKKLSNVEWGSTEHLSERRFKNMQRDVQRGKRFITIPAEERGYSDESTNEFFGRMAVED